MSETDFNYLVDLVSVKIAKLDTNMRESIKPRERLALTLRFLATGDSYHSLMYLFRIPVCTLSKIIPECCEALNEVLKKDYFKIVAVSYKCDFVRASILKTLPNKENGETLYFCWLIDYATLIKTNKVFKLPREIQKITPRCKQASLNNICYLQDHLELGVTGTIKVEESVVPNAGVAHNCLQLISGCDKVIFEVSEKSNGILFGELVIHKKGKAIYLTKELCNRKLIAINEQMFQKLKYNTKEYIRANLDNIYQICKLSQNLCTSHLKFLKSELEEMDIENLPPIENGRRYRKSRVESPTISDNEPNTRKVERENANQAQEKGNQAQKNEKQVQENETQAQENVYHEQIKVTPEIEEDVESNVDSTSSVSIKTVSETTVSPFASITSTAKKRPKGIFLPAGSERSRHSVSKKSTPSNNHCKYRQNDHTISPLPQIAANSHTNGECPQIAIHAQTDEGCTTQITPNTQTDDDCPTIKIPKASSFTDDQVSPEENASKAVEESSSDSSKTPIVTKQDFCRLVAGCTCAKCRVTFEEDDWDTPLKFDSEAGTPMKKTGPAEVIIKPPRLLKPEPEDGKIDSHQNEIVSINYNSMSAIEKKLSCKVLVHGESIPIPIRMVAQVNIHSQIYHNINKINYKESKRIQHYAFPAITRNQHVFMVNDQKTGKTMAYLPILISFVMQKEERYSQLFKMGGGPIVVILCSNSKKCEEIYDMSKMILDRQNRKCSVVTYPGYGNISNIDILITMPTVLATLISIRATNFKRLCHLVLEDADGLLKSGNDLIKKYLNYADQVLEHRHCPKSIQLILCAQHWSVQIENILKRLNEVPLVCIGNYLEAALYGKLKFVMKFLDSGCKKQNLQTILQDKFKYTKSIIICNADEVEDVETFLTLKGIEFISFMNVNQEEDMLYLEARWKDEEPGKYSVLLCTDDIYNTMNVTAAQLLVHFSLPHSWTQFVRRFSCLLENIQTPLDKDKRTSEISSFVFIDEDCEPRMSKFSNFIKIVGLQKQLPENIKTYFQGIELKEEHKRVAKKTNLCHTLKLFGKCEASQCKMRHILDKGLDTSDVLPKNGTIRFKIVMMTDAGSCSIRLLEHFDLKHQSVQKFKDLSEEIAEIISRKHNYHGISKAVLFHLYLHKDKDGFFRCKLLELEDFALVYLIDRGIYCKSNLDSLFKMPEELKAIPPQSYEVHFANLIPPYEDTRFCRLAGRKAQFLVDSNCTGSVMTAMVMLQLGDNLWLDDVYEHLDMHDKSLPSIGFQLSRELVKQGLAVRNTKPLEELYKLCEQADIELPEYKVAKVPTRKVTSDQVQPNWAFLDVNEVHEVIFTFATDPDEFYVRQNKFSKQLAQLEELIQTEIQKPFYPAPREIKIGKCCLVQDPVNGNYCRGMVLNIEEGKAEILSVDYGDVVEADVSTLKHITNDLIIKLPFQCIQCSMYGVKPVDDNWTEAATDLLYTMAYEENKLKLRSLFVKINAKHKNPAIQMPNSYLVTLKDGLLRRVLINELLIDCGFAVPSGQEIGDFDLPEVKPDSDDDSIEEINRSDIESDSFVNDHSDELAAALNTDYSAFECEILNLADFMIDMNCPVRKLDNSKAIEGTSSRELPAIRAAPPVDYLTPEVYWSQSEDSVKLSIKIFDVVSAKILVKHNRNFQFTTLKDGRKYSLNLILFGKVQSKFEHNIFGSQVRVTLRKCSACEWPRLLYTQEKVRKIYYDIGTLPVEQDDDDDQKRRRPLQLGISDDSSSDGDDERPYFVCSDLDSDYDFDIPNDEG